MFSDYSKLPLNREEHKKIVRIIHNLLNMNESVSFRKPVCYRGLQDYKDVIKKPIDLNMIRRNNNQWAYKYVEEVFDDIQLCWDNCRRYNRPGSDIYECAVKMQENFIDEIKKQYPDFQIPPGIIKGRESFPENYSTFVKIDPKDLKNKDATHLQEGGIVSQIYQDENQTPQPQKELVEQTRRPSKKQSKAAKIAEKYIQQQAYIYHDQQQQEPQIFADEVQMKQEEVEPILITLPEYPSVSNIVTLGERIKLIKNQRDILRGVMRIIQEDQKGDLNQIDDTHFSFEASKLRFGTFVRINKFLQIATKM